MTSLADLTRFAEWDERLREVATDRRAVEDAVVTAARLRTSARERGDAPEEARLLGYLANASRMLGRYDEAVSLLGESLAIATRRVDERARVVALIRLGETHRCAGSFSKAEACLDQALRLTRESRLEDLEDFALQHLGKTYLDTGRGEQARAALSQALAVREARGDAALIESARRALEKADRAGGLRRDQLVEDGIGE